MKTIHRFEVGVSTAIEHAAHDTPEVHLEGARQPLEGFQPAATRPTQPVVHGPLRDAYRTLAPVLDLVVDAALGWVEFHPGILPRRQQAGCDGEDGFDLSIHDLAVEGQRAVVVPPTVMFVELSISTKNGIEPQLVC